MLKKFSIFLAVVVAATSFIGCNKDSNSTVAEFAYSSTQVRSFRLQANKKILNSLDTVFFTIDLVNAKIFNADSLPYGTKVNKLQVYLTTDACSTVELIMMKDDGSDTIVNYLTNSTDSINFANGPVMLHVVSYDGKAERNYELKVNVHTVVPDSLYWDEMYGKSLPTNLPTPTAQRTVKMADKAYCLTTDGSAYCMASCTEPDGEWIMATVNPGFNADVTTLTATDEVLYMLSTDGDLYRSTDGTSWVDTDEEWCSIIGSYEGTLLGVKESAGVYYHATYPTTAFHPIPEEFPVSDFSEAATVASRWTEFDQKVIVGGRKADGSLSKAVWGYDGSNWAQLSESLPVALARPTLLYFEISKTDTVTWTNTKMPALLLFGGISEDGLNSTTYISRDMGMNWKKADKLLQLPDYIEPRYDAQALVYTTILTRSRAIAPITEWPCPYIYLFGGFDKNGTLCNSVWKGTINRFEFKPLQ